MHACPHTHEHMDKKNKEHTSNYLQWHTSQRRRRHMKNLNGVSLPQNINLLKMVSKENDLEKKYQAGNAKE